MFTADWCAACRQAKRWLQQRAVRFEERNIQAQPSAAADLRRLNASGSIPTFLVDGAVISGFNPGVLEAAIRKAEQARALPQRR